MIMDMSPGPQAGHNNPPDALLLEADERVDVATKWLEERAEIADKDIADKAAFFVSQITATFNALDGQRKKENNAWDATQAAKYSGPLRLLTMAKEKLVAMRRAWLLKEQAKVDEAKRIADAQAKKIADEAAAAAKRAQEKTTDLRAQLEAEEASARAELAQKAAAAAPTKAVIKGSFTTTAVGLRTVWLAEVTDRQAAFKHYKKNAFLNRAIDEALASIASAESKITKNEAKAPPGVRFYSEQR